MTNTDAIESLRSFAAGYLAGARAEHGDPVHFLAFTHMCTAALQGEEWAAERMMYTIARIEDMQIANGLTTGSTAYTLDVIRTTDCTRPDGAVPRSIEI